MLGKGNNPQKVIFLSKETRKTQQNIDTVWLVVLLSTKCLVTLPVVSGALIHRVAFVRRHFRQHHSGLSERRFFFGIPPPFGGCRVRLVGDAAHIYMRGDSRLSEPGGFRYS